MYLYEKTRDWIQQCPISIASHNSRDQGTKHNCLRSVSYKVCMCYLVSFCLCPYSVDNLRLQVCIALANMQCNINKAHIEYHTSLDLLTVMGCTRLLTPQIEYTYPLNCVHCSSVQVVDNV